MGSRVIGRVRTWVEGRGFGFVFVEDQPREIFVHARDVAGGRHVPPEVGDMVELELVDTERGPKGVRAVIVKRAAEAARR